MDYYKKTLDLIPINIVIFMKSNTKIGYKILYSNKKFNDTYNNIIKTSNYDKLLTKYLKKMFNESSQSIFKSYDKKLKINFECFKQNKIIICLGYDNNKNIEFDKLKSSFFNNITHSIRTPLSNIIGFSHLLENNSKIDKNILTIIKRNSNLLLNTINNILKVANIDTNNIQIKNNKCILNDIINDVYLSNKNSIKPNVKFIIQKSPNTIVYSDDNIISIILFNLVSNSIKFTNKGYIKIGYHMENQNIVFYVKDTGCGITRENLQHLFDEYLYSTNKGGLGLPIIKKLINLMNGNIWLITEKNKGTTFFFSIPVL
jgi:signal transduction histidine kinase